MARALLLLLGIATFADASSYMASYDSYASYEGDPTFFVDKWDSLVEACDANDDGLDTDEWDCLFVKLGITEEHATHEATYGDSFGAADANSDGVVDGEEPEDWITDMTDDDFQNTIIMAMLGIQPGGVENMLGDLVNAVSPGMAAAAAVVKLKLTVAESVEDWWPDEQDAFKIKILEALDLSAIPVADTLFTFAAGSSVAESTIFVPTAADAARASGKAGENLGTPEAASEALGVEVTEITFEARSASPTTSTTEPIIVAIVAVLLGVVTCCGFAKRCASKRRAAWGADYEGCCSTGVCSGYALKGWAIGGMLAALFLLGCLVPTYVAVNSVAVGIECILTAVDTLVSLDAFAPLAAPLSPVMALVNPFRPQIALLPIAALVPALLGAVWLVLTSLCAAKTSSTMKAAKCLCVLDFVFLLVGAVFYIIIAAAGWLVASDFAAPYIKLFTSQCDALVPKFKGMLGTIDSLAEASDDAALENMKDALVPGVEAMESLCGCAIDILFSLGNLFSAGLLATFASFYCIFVIHGICCSAKCCKSPGVTGTPNKVDAA